MEELVSVVVLTYKNINGLYETLKSVFAQDYGNIEVIVSDDGSPDFKNHISEIEDFFRKNAKSNIKDYCINALDVNVGTVKNLNSALKKAKGKYIKGISSDDTFTCNDALSRMVKFIKNSDFLIAFAKMRGVTPKGEYKYELASCESDYDMLRKLTPQETLNKLFWRDFLPAPAWIIDRELFEKYGYFKEDTRLIEDYPYWIYLCLNDVSFGYIDEVLINYKMSGVSSTGSYNEAFMNDMFSIYEKYIFPYDKRYGAFQGLYNKLKMGGLNYYMSEAKRSKMTKGQRTWARIKYFPFHVYVKSQNKKVEKANQRN